MQFVILHGSFKRPPWTDYIREELTKLGQDVLAPEFSVDTWDRVTQLGKNHASDVQSLIVWKNEFEKQVLPKLKDNACFIGHSLGCLFILHMVSEYNLRLKSAIFVAPFLEKLNRDWQIDNVNASFYKADFDFEKLQKSIPTSLALYSNNDPYVPAEKAKEFAHKLNSTEIEVKGGGHFNKAEFTEFPQLLKLCKKVI